ncbi:DJ-1/PfpI family protein [Desulfosporosinus nitroreducens]|uniref:DJ-1/PfpI family protein n=1 Tax=Desulfosporosinus nitroreducens TaxID=2018668 RepID=UPI00207C78B0|nr:DJ-1/PfpI family protein [Desulfosporosinus nitroreducens]MCO1604674.1 DJ-1/PfpI family protein [Desulfosporosinus nitroreducens]
MSKVLMFMYDEMADFEVTLACQAVTLSKRELITVAYEKKTLTSNSGIMYIPHRKVTDIESLDDVEGLIIPGGPNIEMRPELTELIKRLNAANKFLAAICGGPQFLARSGVLTGHKYTTSLTPEYYKENNMEDPFPRDTFVRNRIIRDGNIVTALPTALIDFAVEIGNLLGLFRNPEEKIQMLKSFKQD